MDPSVPFLIDIASKAGALGMAIFLIVGFMREWIVTGKAYQRLIDTSKEEIRKSDKDRDEWRAIALTSTPLANRAVGLAESNIERQKYAP